MNDKIKKHIIRSGYILQIDMMPCDKEFYCRARVFKERDYTKRIYYCETGDCYKTIAEAEFKVLSKIMSFLEKPTTKNVDGKPLGLKER